MAMSAAEPASDPLERCRWSYRDDAFRTAICEIALHLTTRLHLT
jgi:hypothetical protein